MHFNKLAPYHSLTIDWKLHVRLLQSNQQLVLHNYHFGPWQFQADTHFVCVRA
jgi:hypothetical protein